MLLGSELKRRGHEVTIVAFGKFEQMARDAGLGFSPLAGDVMELMERIMKPGVNGALPFSIRWRRRWERSPRCC